MLTNIAALATDDVWAIGGDGTDPLIVHWDGVTWTESPTPNPPGIVGLGSISAVSPTDIWAGGTFNRDPFGAQSRNVTMHWDGLDWSFVPTPTIGTGHNFLSDLVAVSDSDAWIVGHYTPGGGGEERLFSARWNGQEWQLVDTPQPVRPFIPRAATVLGTEVRAVGALDLNGRSRAAEMRWNGSAWVVDLMANIRGTSSDPFDVAPDLTGGLWAVGTMHPDFSSPSSPLVERFCAGSG
jgi:hypothetical protein